MNAKRTDGDCLTVVLPRTRKNAHQERRERQAWALEIVKAIRKSPSAPEPPPAPLLHTHIAGDPEAPGYVYFAYSAGRIKIGYSTNVTARLYQYSTHSPMPVVLLLTINGSEDDEGAYHQKFAEERVNLEWFRLSPRLREFLESRFQGSTLEKMMNAEMEAYEAMVEGSVYIGNAIKDIEEEANASL